MKVLSLVNQKGGVAKTTSAIALADHFARHGKKVLLIDFDPQGSLTASFGQRDDTDNPQALRFLALEKNGAEATVDKVTKNLCLIKSDMGLEKANAALITRVGKERFLRRAIERLNAEESFDYVIIDSNPSFSQLTINVIYASDEILVPFKPEYNSFKGIQQLFENVAEMRELRSQINILGFIVTMYRKTTSAEQSVGLIGEFAKKQNCTLFLPPIRLAVAAADAPSHGVSLYDYKAGADVTQDYETLSANVLSVLEGKL